MASSRKPRSAEITAAVGRALERLQGKPIAAHASEHRLKWVEDESNASDAFTRNFLRLRIAPLLSERYPRWREALARAARHFGRADVNASTALRGFLATQGLRAPSEAKLIEMLKQLTARGSNPLIR